MNDIDIADRCVTICRVSDEIPIIDGPPILEDDLPNLLGAEEYEPLGDPEIPF